MPAQNRSGFNAIDARREGNLNHFIHLHTRKNLLASPLSRLPTKSILKILVHAVDPEPEDIPWLPLTAIIHRLREISPSSLRLWSAVNFTLARFAKPFPEQCGFDSRVPFTTRSNSASGTDDGVEMLFGGGW